MSILTGGQWEAPFWGADGTFITGQDMLGMQNTSIATYAALLPGLTNLTRRIRYYGFYAWLLEEYAKRKGKVSIVEFRQFMRRGELLLAFVMSHAYPEEQGVVGSQYAKATLYEGGNVIDIAKGADLATERRTYWKYSTGAFVNLWGQIFILDRSASFLIPSPHGATFTDPVRECRLSCHLPGD